MFGRAPAARACRCAPRPSTCARAGGVHSVPSAHAAWNILRAGRGPRPSCARRRRHAGKDRALVRRGRVDSPRRARTGGRSRALPRTRTSRSPESCSLANASLGAACRAGRHRLGERAELRDALAAAGSSTTAAEPLRACLTVYAPTRVNPLVEGATRTFFGMSRLAISDLIRGGSRHSGGARHGPPGP